MLGRYMQLEGDFSHGLTLPWHTLKWRYIGSDKWNCGSFYPFNPLYFRG